MLKILDRYLLFGYLKMILLSLSILIPISIVIDFAEKSDKFLSHEDLTFFIILKDHYLNFVIYYANTFLPLATFLACIMFTSRLAKKTEIIAIHSAAISFTRFLRPYFICATMLMILSLGMNHFVVPKSSKISNEFENKYLSLDSYSNDYITNFNLQIDNNAKIFIKNFSLFNNKGYFFSYSEFDGIKIKYKIFADKFTWNEKSKNFTLTDYRERFIFPHKDSIHIGNKKTMSLNFTPQDISISDSKSMDLSSDKLLEFIEKSEKRGIKNLNNYHMDLHQRTSLPISSYILTLIAVSLSCRKKRGGSGLNLAIGISLMFSYIFFMKIAKVLGSVADSIPIFMAWIPNILFSIIAFYLFLKEKRQE